MKQPRGAAGTDFILFILFLIVLGVVWAVTGGPARDISREGPFLNAPSPLGDGNAYGVPSVNTPEFDNKYRGDTGSGNSSFFTDIISRVRSGVDTTDGEEKSPYAEYVSLSISSARNSDPSQEYVTIKTSRSLSDRITISDWRLESSVTLAGSALGSASYLPFSGQVNTESPVAIGPNTTVYVTTGRAPIGVSFRTNTCTGYFEQFQDFQPRLKLECPFPEDEFVAALERDAFIPNAACIDYVDDLNRCIFNINNVPQGIGGACQNFALNDLTYNGCVSLHKNDAEFYKSEWRMYLDRDQELWRSKNERIRLLDENGKVIDVISY